MLNVYKNIFSNRVFVLASWRPKENSVYKLIWCEAWSLQHYQTFVL